MMANKDMRTRVLQVPFGAGVVSRVPEQVRLHAANHGGIMSAGTVCSRVVATAGPDETVRTAAQRMATNNVGSLVVKLPEGSPALYGMVTDRDIAVCCVAGRLDPDRTPIREVMTSPVHSIDEFTPLEEAVSLMASSAVRRLVVTGANDQLVGILTLDDMLEHLIKVAGSVGRLLERQQAHVVG